MVVEDQVALSTAPPRLTRVKFLLRAEPSESDNRTTVINVLWMQLLDDEDDAEFFAFPPDKKHVSQHEELFAIPAAAAAKRDLAPRWEKRTFKISLPPDVASIYVNDSGNAVFRGSYLNIFNPSDMVPPPVRTTASSVPPSTSSNSASAPRPLTSIVKDIALTKFNPKFNVNPEAWVRIFESECQRLEIGQDRYWQVIRLFLEESAEKWYSTTRFCNDTTSWDFWRNSFVDNFGVRGLAAARTAYTYHYVGGSLSDYCQNKLSLLVSFNPKMHELDRICLVTLGLPQYLQNRINVSEIDSIGKLLSTINSFDKPSVRSISSSPSSSNSSSTPNSSSSSHAFSSLRNKSLCGYCKKTKNRDLFHKESECFSKMIDEKRKGGKNNVDSKKSINSFEVDELQKEIDECQKNE